jgi:hypothetical protein
VVILLILLVAGCTPSAPAEPEVTCIGLDADACNSAWRALVHSTGQSTLDSEGRNRVTEVTVRKTFCDAAIEVWFSDGTGVITAGGLC